MEKLNIQEIHWITLGVMDKLHEICEKNNIKYYVMYGSLIGAIRHKGFIPWDDDFDVCMMREDYNRFIRIVSELDDHRYKIASRDNTINYTYGIIRFYDSDYIYKTKLGVKQFELGVFVDVYPLDACGETEEETYKMYKQIRRLNLGYKTYCNKYSSKSIFRTMLKIPYHYYLHSRYGKSYPKIIDSIIENKIYDKFRLDSEYVANYWENMKTFCVFKRVWFEKRLLADFENHRYWIPKNYDEILKLYYGDYMQLPSKEDRVPSHSYIIYKK